MMGISILEYLDRLCMGCMSIMPNFGVCPVCGFNERVFSSSLHHLPLRTILGGRYLVGRVLGEGGFGITYIGFDLKLEQKTAIKEYYPSGFVTREAAVTSTVTPYVGELGEFFIKGRARFTDEANTLARFNTLPGIVSVKDFFTENGTEYLVMEYISGRTLKKCIEEKGGRLPVEAVLEMLRPVIGSLAVIHKSGIVHRDISPDNIMITGEGNVKLLDFGAAREYNDNDKSRSIVLKPGFSPEEQYRSKGVQGPWTDVYALCATIYSAVTGVMPEEANERLHEDRLIPPSSLDCVIKPHVEGAILRGMALYAQDRIRDMETLERMLYADITVFSFSKQLHTFVKSRWALICAGTFILVAVTGVLFTAFSADKAINYDNGDRYIGEAKGSVRNGKGTLISGLGYSVTGEWREDVLISGSGELLDLDGNRYNGIWQDGSLSGEGSCYYANGDVYSGGWVNGLWEGRGVLTLSDGTVYDGEFFAGFISGRGRCTYPDGEFYDGDWQNGKRSGRGIYKYMDGSTYDGEWSDDIIEGYGTAIWKTGDRYEGEWKSFLCDGSGRYTWVSGEYYDGEWNNGKRSGYGTLYLTDNTLSGNWLDDEFIG